MMSSTRFQKLRLEVRVQQVLHCLLAFSNLLPVFAHGRACK